MLEPYDTGILLNPRRKNFPIHDPNAAEEQITWEYHALNNCNFISMWFSSGPSVQPICLYELGRHLALRKDMIIGIEPGYLREQDVRIQIALINPDIKIATTLEEHVNNILQKLSKI